MDTTKSLDQHIGPLAFCLSVRTETVLPALYSNAVNTSHIKLYPVLLSLASGVAAGAAVLAFGLPSWVAVPAAVAAAYKSFKPFKRYFQEAYVDGRATAIRNQLASALTSEDALHLSRIATPILNSQYGNQEWASRISGQLSAGQVDPFKFLGTVFAYAPDLWQVCSQNVYARALAGVVPSASQPAEA